MKNITKQIISPLQGVIENLTSKQES